MSQEASSQYSSHEDESFLLFSQLPFELRSQIWMLSIVDSPRIVYLQQHNILSSSPTTLPASKTRKFQNTLIHSVASRPTSTPPPEPDTQTTAYKSRCPPPAILSICSESRAIAQTFYTLAFDSQSHPPLTYISFAHDALYLSYSFLRDAVTEISGAFYNDLQDDIRKVKHLMIGGVWAPFSQMPWDTEFMTCLIKALAAFGGLETVALVDGRHGEDEPEVVVLNARCAYECWESHLDEDERESTCLRESDPDRDHLLRYGECMSVQEPEGLERWPSFWFRTVVPKGKVPGGGISVEKRVCK